MKFAGGSRVEVSRRNEDHVTAWFPAKIISFDEREYNIRFESLRSVKGKGIVEKVPEEDVRPFPPPVQEEKIWTPGDVAEVFDCHSWRLGKVMKVLHSSCFVVKPFGSIQLREFQKSNLRVRQEWHNGRWVVIDKADGEKQFGKGCTGLKTRKTLPLCFGVQGSKHDESSRGDRDIQYPKSKGFDKRRKANNKVSGSCRVNSRSQHGKIYDFSSPLDMACENMHTPTIKDVPRAAEKDAQKEKKLNQAMHSFSRHLQIVEETNECSVASCSGNNIAENTVLYAGRRRYVANGSFDDAMSSCPSESGKRCIPSCQDELTTDIHELELHAYKSTVQALYASGPLSWEQESLLTNLRLSLHISIEEHLHQLRSLLSA